MLRDINRAIDNAIIGVLYRWLKPTPPDLRTLLPALRRFPLPPGMGIYTSS